MTDEEATTWIEALTEIAEVIDRFERPAERLEPSRWDALALDPPAAQRFARRVVFGIVGGSMLLGAFVLAALVVLRGS